MPLMAISSLALACLALAAFLYKAVFYRQQTKRNLPPGPKPWPIIGNLNLVGSIPHQSLHFLSQKYGELMQLKFGTLPVVVASSPEMAKQFLRVHDTTFASRPALSAGKYTSYNYSDMTWAPYGPYWRQTRKIYSMEVFNAKKLESFEHIRVEEGRNFLSRLHSLSGKPVVFRDHLSRFSISSISRMVFSNKYFNTESEDEKAIMKVEELRGMLDEWLFLGGAFYIGDWAPWLSYLDLQGYVKRMKAVGKKLDRLYSYVLDDHLTRKAARTDFIPEDVLDSLLQLAEDPNLEIKLTRDHNLLVGGTDTTATTLEWTIHEILRHPQTIEKAKEELDRVIGRDRWVEEKDHSQLPYIDAIIMESMRLHPIATLLAPHYAMEDCKVAGYDIAKGTAVLINTWSLGRDPNSWDSPFEFLPERFLDKDIDIMGSNFSILPFGSGRRRCPGYALGLKVIRTTLANLLHGFELKLVGGMKPEDVSVEEVYGLTTHPKEPLTIIMEPTLPDHLY
ncbi:UNVERIFIED_CONTAM: Trimethyltridecatetraene synthase [Sesamum calycinum]|uniref:Trimethyltridecatetraene synthase n=1 Tax=Sesamum calycinum TaxID=2727403 RepID=A0AAW2J473_9LAMI